MILSPVDCRSVSVSDVVPEVIPVMFHSATQKHDALSVTETESYAAVHIAKEMPYVMNILLTIGLFVEV